MLGSPTEAECNIPTRSTETNNEITRARLWWRDNRDFGGKSAKTGRGWPPVGVSRDTGGEPESRETSSQLVAAIGVSTEKAQAAGLSFVC